MGLEEARQSYRIAVRKLTEADVLDVEKAPGAVVHDAYYAMHHAAKALVLARTDTSPFRHVGKQLDA